MKIPFGEFAPDSATINTEYASIADNVIAGATGYYSIPNAGAVDHTCGAEVTSAVDIKIGLNELTIAGGGSKIYVDGNECQKVGLSSISSNIFNEYIVWGDDLIIFGSPTPPQKISATDLATLGTNKTSNLAGSPPSAKTAAKVREFLVAGNTTESSIDYRNRVRWSSFENPEAWTAGTDQSDYQDLTIGGDVMRVVGGEYGIIFQREGITRMTYVGSPLIFQFDPIDGAAGTFSPESVVVVGSDIYYLGTDGFYVLRSFTSSERIGANKVDRWFFETAGGGSDGLELERVKGVYDRRSGVIFWSFRTSAQNLNTPNNKIIAYNLKTNKWSTLTFDNTCLVSSYEEANEIGADDALKPFVLSYFNASNQYLSLSGSGTLSATLETGEFGGERFTEITEVRPLVDGVTTVTTKTRNTLSGSVTSVGPTSTDSSGKANVRTNARYTRLECATTGAFTEATGVEIKVRQGASR